jgi:aminomethyltransferase
MTQTALYQRLASAGARMGSYNGAEGVAAFTDPGSELRALVSGCGIFDLRWRAKIAITGKDRVRWLNGMVTNTIKDLPPNRGNYSFVLNPQGRILGDMYIYNRGESLLLDTDRSQLETVMNTLKRFIIMDKVELADCSEALNAIGLCGPNAGQILASAGIDCSGLQPLEVRDLADKFGCSSVVRGPEQKPGWYEVWSSENRLQGTGYRLQEGSDNTSRQAAETGDNTGLWERLTNSGAQPVGTDALELWRILHGIPKYGQDIRERDLPQETEQAQALNFTKGCYIGQEIVERIRSRGQVHRKFTGFEFPDAALQPGKFEENGRVVAEITSVAQIGAKRVGLGYVRRESGPAGAKLNLGATTATVTDPPFQIEWN